MELENIFYGGVQLVHNFGAAAVTGLPIAALCFNPAPPVLRRMALLTLVAWLAQSASGAGFGTVSFFMEGELPQIHHLALGALIVKIACAVLAVTLLTVHFLWRTASGPGVALWRGLAILGITALTSAAVLRWFS
jgi:uncharacterized membrane protein YdbT with pleckstrin-like domain